MLRALAVVTVLTAAACEPSWSIHGQVAVADAALRPGTPDQARLAPLPRALVTLRCPALKGASASEVSVMADPMGFFELTGSGPAPLLECEVIAQAPGHHRSVTSLDDACADDGEGEGRCVNAAMLARLERE
jgi:hypothetical protein